MRRGEVWMCVLDPVQVDWTPKIAGEVLPKPLHLVGVRISGIAAEVLHAGGAPGLVAGVLQVNSKVPSGVPSGEAIPVVLTIGGVNSQPGVTLAVR